jgi:hypothetical protein
VSADAVDLWWSSELHPTPVQLFARGRHVNAMPVSYGAQDVTVCYEGNPIGRFGHVKLNQNHYHSYSVSIWRGPSGGLAVTATAVGPGHQLWVESPLAPEASGRACGPTS